MREQLRSVVEGGELSVAAMEAAMETILSGQASPVQTAALLTALRMRGETADELAAAARVMRRHALPVRLAGSYEVVLDTCGTGGDGSESFNISTLAALVVAATGVKVAKHGNRAATSRCGSADLLEALGVNLELRAERIAAAVEDVGIGFMFARQHHPAMRHVAPIRAELGFRTLFNLLGPLSNPAGASHQLLGVGDPTQLRLLAEVLRRLGTVAAWVVSGEGGLDELALSGPSRVVELREGKLTERSVSPADFGLPVAPKAALVGGDAAHNAELARRILAGERGPLRDAVVLNAAAAVCVADAGTTPRAAAARAAEALDSGAAGALLERWVAFGRTS
jgi:anthranilate phosphoribosyltransferase